MKGEASRPPRLLLDAMLGDLARRLRLLGVDAATMERSDRRLARYRCLAESRVLVTRDRRLALSMGEGAFMPVGEGKDEELASLRPLLGDVAALVPFSRCTVCNGELLALDREEAAPLVPPHVYREERRFSRCGGCGRVYWAGTHHRRMSLEVERMLGLLGG